MDVQSTLVNLDAIRKVEILIYSNEYYKSIA